MILRVISRARGSGERSAHAFWGVNEMQGGQESVQGKQVNIHD